MLQRAMATWNAAALKDAARAVALETVLKQPERQRGLWSFLTWSFFLAQTLAAEAFVGSAAKAAHDDSSSDHANGSDASRAYDDLARSAAGQTAGEGETNAGSDAGGGSHDANLANLVAGLHEGAQGAPIALASAHGVLAAGSAVAVELEHSGSPTPSASGDQAGAFPPNDPGSLGGSDGGQVAVGVEIDPGLGLHVGTDVALDLGHVVGLDLGLDLSHVLGSDINFDGGIEIDLNPTLKAQFSDLSETVSHMLDGVRESGLLAEGGDETLGKLTETVSNSVEGPATAVAHVVSDAVDFGSLGQAVSSGGTITLPLLKTVQADDLFSGGRYTDYNLSLPPGADGHDNSEKVDSDTAGKTGSLSSLVDSLTDHHDAHASADAADQDVHASHIGVPSVLDELGLRGLSHETV
jgi:hypothetical protein